MKPLSRLLLCVLGVFAVEISFAADYPAQDGYVYDGAGMLSAADEAELEKQLSEYEEQTTIGIAVATVPTLGGTESNAYAIELGNRWAIGDAAKDNGVVVVLAKQERELAVWFADGYESGWSDKTSQRLRDGVMVPQLMRGDHAGAISAGVEAVIRELESAQYPAIFTGTAQSVSGYADSRTAAPVLPSTNAPAAPPRKVYTPRELRGRGYVMGAIVLGVALLFLLILRSSAITKRRELQAEIATLIEALTHKLEQLPAVEQKLRAGYPESMWGPALGAINASAIERLLYTDAEKRGRTNIELARQRDELRIANGACERAIELLRRAEAARANVPGLLRELPSRFDALRAELQGPDVPRATAAQLEPLRVRLGELSERAALAQPDTAHTDWAALGDAVDKLTAEAEALRTRAAQESAEVGRARTELPAMLAGAEQQLAELAALNRGRYGDVEASLAEASGMLGDWRGYGDLRRLPADDVYVLLSALNNALARAQHARTTYEHHSAPRSSGSSFGSRGGGGGSSSWGGSSGGSSFGGSRGGGGGSSKW